MLTNFNKDRLIWSIDDANKDIYYKMKAAIAGGPSIIFKRYAEKDETYIRRGEKLCKLIYGVDANALYLWALGNDMPCGQLTTIEPYDDLINDIMNDKEFAILNVILERLNISKSISLSFARFSKTL